MYNTKQNYLNEPVVYINFDLSDFSSLNFRFFLGKNKKGANKKRVLLKKGKNLKIKKLSDPAKKSDFLFFRKIFYRKIFFALFLFEVLK